MIDPVKTMVGPDGNRNTAERSIPIMTVVRLMMMLQENMVARDLAMF